MSVGSLYQYFPNKDAILYTLMLAHLDAGARLLAQRLADGVPARLPDAIRLMVAALIDNHRDQPRLHRVLFEEAPRAPAFLARLHDAEKFIVGVAAGLLEAHPEVSVPDTEVAARIVVATVESLVHRLITAPFPIDPQQLEDEVVVLLTGYLRRGRDEFSAPTGSIPETTR